jgi:hypothetical protein
MNPESNRGDTVGGDVRYPPRAAKGRASLALCVMAAVLALFFAPALYSSAQFLYLDTGRYFEPLKRYLAQELLQGRFPAWNPYSGMGVPLVSGAIASPQHPFNLLLLPSFDIGFKSWIFLSYLLAAGGAFAWARVLGRGWHAAVGAGLAFATSGFLVSQSNNLQYLTAYSAIPLFFAAVHAWLEFGGPFRLALVGATSALCAAAGDPQSWGFALLAAPVCALIIQDVPGGCRHAVLRATTAALVSMFAAAPFVLPIVAWLSHSSRSFVLPLFEYQKWNLHPIRLIEFAVPSVFRADLGAVDNPVFKIYAGNEWTELPWAISLYIGAICLAFALLGAVRSRPARWLLVAAALFTWMAMGANGGFWEIAKRLPLMRSFRYWEKLAVWTTLFLAIASAFGLDALTKDRTLARRAALGAGAVAVVSLLSAVLLTAQPDAAARFVEQGDARAAGALVANLSRGLLHTAVACMLLAVVLYCIVRGRLLRMSQALLVCVMIADVASANYGAYYLSDNLHWGHPPLAAPFVSEKGVHRILVPFGPVTNRWPKLDTWENVSRWWARTLEMPWNVPARVGNFRAYEGMIQDRMFRYQLETSFTPMVGAGLWGVSAMIVPDAPEAAAQVRVPPPYRVLGVDPELPAYAVEIPHRPRAYLAGSLIRTDETGALRFVLDSEVVSSGITVIESEIPSDWAPYHGEVSITRDEPCLTSLETHSEGKALLILNDANAPGWVATVDRRAAAILPVNYLARGVWVEAGVHTVVFEYHTPLLREGWGIFGLTAGAITVWALIRKWQSRSGVASA